MKCYPTIIVMQNDSLLFTEEIYTLYLQIINGIKFTPREIDIIACIMSGKNPQAIANFLSSPHKPIELKTVSTHISNIRRKIDGNARGSIIDFIEKSDKHQMMHSYYLSLLVHKEFHKYLQEVIPIIASNVESITIVSYGQDAEERNALRIEDAQQIHAKAQRPINSHYFITYLQNHLKQLSPNVFVERDKQSPGIRTLPRTLPQLYYRIYLLPTTLKLDEVPRNTTQNNKSSSNILLLLQNNQTDLTNIPFECIDVNSQQNYYLLFFDILQKLFHESKNNLENIRARFYKRLESIQGTNQNMLNLQPIQEDNELQKNQARSWTKTRKFFSTSTYMIFIAVILIMESIYLTFNVDNTEHIPEPKTAVTYSKISSYIPEVLTGYEIFIGRQNELEKIRNLLKNNNIVVITGRSGVGKSSCAIEYAKSEKQTKIVRYFNADSLEKIDRTYRELAQELYIDVNKQPSNMVMQLVNSRLNALKVDILFIFDNVECYEDVKDYLVNLPIRVKVVITTTLPRLIADKANIELKSFSPLEAEQYLETALYNRNLSEEVKQELIRNVGTLPYDLKCTVAYLLDNPSVDTKIITREIGSNIKNKLFQQFVLSKDATTQQAWKILQYAANLDPDYINIDILKALFPKNHNLLSNAIKKLESISLISIVSDHKGRLGIRVHRESQESTQYIVSNYPIYAISLQEVENNLLNVLDALFTVTDNNPSIDWYTADTLLPHVKQLIHRLSTTSNYNKKLLSNLYYKLGKYYSAVNIDFKQALPYAKTALKIRQSLYNDNNPDIASSIDSIGTIYIYKNARDIKNGIHYLKKALKMRQSIYGAIHPEVAASQRNIGMAYLKLDREEALQYFLASLKTRQLIYTSNNPSIAESLNDVAWVYYELGNYNTATEYIEKSVSMYEGLYPRGHPSTIYALHTLGALLIHSHDYTKAQAVLYNALDIAKAYDMGNHYTTAFIYYDLGRTYFNLGDYKNALDYSFKALQIRQEIHRANNHPNQIFESYNVIGDIYVALGNTTKAIESYKTALAIRNKLSLGDSVESEQVIQKIKELKSKNYLLNEIYLCVIP